MTPALIVLACGDPGVPSLTSSATPVTEGGRLAGITEAHNLVRRPLGIADLTWDDALAGVATAYAALLADDGCDLVHSTGPYGENLYWSSFESTVDDVVGAWASEVAFYDYDSNRCDAGEQCGHYTQIVWADTAVVGCGLAPCNGLGEVWVCNYDPPGNWVGERPY